MTHNPHIADARRLARSLAREKGISYQAVLDDLAQQVGRSDWKAFTQDPVAIPAPDPEPVVPSTVPDEIPSHSPAVRRTMRSKIALVLGAIVLLSLAVNVYLFGHVWRTQDQVMTFTRETMTIPHLEIPAFTGAYPVTDIQRAGDHVTFKTVPVDARLVRTVAMPLLNDGRIAYLRETIPSRTSYNRMTVKVDCRTGNARLMLTERGEDESGPFHRILPKSPGGVDLGITPRTTLGALCSADTPTLLDRPARSPNGIVKRTQT